MVSASLEPSQVALAIISDEVLSPCQWESLARLIHFVKVYRYQPGESIYQEYEAANQLFIIYEGDVLLKDQKRTLPWPASTRVIELVKKLAPKYLTT